MRIGILSWTALCGIGAVVFLLGGSGWRNPFRDARRGEVEFRELLGSFSPGITHEDVRARVRGYDELRFYDGADGSNLFLRPHLRYQIANNGDLVARLRYTADGRLYRVQAGYVTSNGDPIPGIPKERCFVPPEECASLVRAQDAAWDEANRRR